MNNMAIGNENMEIITGIMKTCGEPMKISEIACVARSMGHKITHDMVVNYFFDKRYRIVDKCEKSHPYKYKLIRKRKITVMGE